jgi:hypothetical protein
MAGPLTCCRAQPGAGLQSAGEIASLRTPDSLPESGAAWNLPEPFFKRDYDAPVRIANEGTICREAVCGAGFADVVIRAFFGFHPGLNDQRMLWEPEQPRGFSSQLKHVRYPPPLRHYASRRVSTGKRLLCIYIRS